MVKVLKIGYLILNIIRQSATGFGRIYGIKYSKRVLVRFVKTSRPVPKDGGEKVVLVCDLLI